VRRLPLVSLLCAALLGLTGCGSDAPAASGAAGDSPAATGGFGVKPDLTIPDGSPPKALDTEVLVQGKGPAVVKGDLLVIDYLGQTWKPKDGKENVFDNTYDRKQKAAFPVGAGTVLKGWDTALLGQRVGSRLLVTVPPDQAYGDKAAGDIPAGSTLVFVLDVVDRFGRDSAASGSPVGSVPAGLPTVRGGTGGGKAPTVDLAGTKPPKDPRAALLIQGDGKPVKGAANVVVQVLDVSWPRGAKVSSTYDSAPTALPADEIGSQLPALGAVLEKATVGSRLLLTLPAAKNRPGNAVVLDVVGTF
jgi:peptidylprolyl isomerase